MDNLAIVVRTCTHREDRADILAQKLSKCTGSKFYIVNCKTEKNYSESFVIGLAKVLQSLDETIEFLLIVEDDMLFSKNLKSDMNTILKKEIPFCWLSIPEKRMYDESFSIGEGCRFLETSVSIYYSGSVFCNVLDLKNYIEDYMLRFLELPQRQFDVSLSAYLVEKYGCLFLKCGVFASDKTLLSLLVGKEGRQRIEVSPDDPFFDFENCEEINV